jgi:hypothetical protein
MNHRPIAIGMLLCENVIVEEGTHNVTPVNCFSFREVEDFPAAATFFAVAWLANGLGQMRVELLVQRLDNLEECFRLSRDLQFPDRLVDMRFVAKLRTCPLPVAGYYEVSLIVEGEQVASRKFHVRKKGDKP